MAARKSSVVALRAGETANLAELENLTEQTLLAELKLRFQRDIIYTYVGEILVTVNPFKWVPGIYAVEKMREYTLCDKQKLPPHLFAVADAAFQSMLSTNENQVCVISGESGAGKTEAAKLFVKKLVQGSNGAEVEGLEEKLVQVNPLLEAFGNAKTGMNNNSSRFGKFVSVRFSREGVIKGAVMREYLLEKSRVIHQGDDEQSFHIFYIMHANLSAAEAEMYELPKPDVHRYISGNADALAKIGSKDMQAMKKELHECMEIVGFTPEQSEDLYHLLSGVLHLGDIEFEGEDAAKISSDKGLLTTVCNQLSIDETALELALTRQVNIIRGEETEREYKLAQAEDCRDASAKAIYGAAFSWIVEQCNTLLGPKQAVPSPGDTSMGILDIFGFECFDRNSFEQLCINLANENLQFFFNNHIFAMELAEYAKEGITGKDITYKDNKGLLDLLLENRPLGLLGILDEESNFPKATDSSMVQKFHAAFAKMEDYERPKGNEDIFTLKHYAGRVTYDGFGFLEKNRDTLAVDVIGALRLSENALVKLLFGGDAPAASTAGGKRKPAAARAKLDRQASKGRMRMSIKHAQASLAKKKKKTVASTFKESLAELMQQLNAAAPHFIRCVKPNVQKKDGIFTDELVTKQLRYTGMLETTRIRREGYASRPLFADFVKRYRILGFECRADVRPTGESCRRILDKSRIQGFEIGHTKVFLRYWHVDQLNDLLRPFAHASSILSAVLRFHSARCKYRALLATKREQEKKVETFINSIERSGQGMRDVVVALCEEDARRPPPKADEPLPPPPPAKAAIDDKSASQRKKAGMQRAASVKWFKEVEKKKGAGQDARGAFATWFHGIITRKDSEDLLSSKESGTFLIRVAESRFGYSLSLMFQGRCKHFMIDQNDGGQYVVVGNDRTFPSLNDIVVFHKKYPVTDDGDLLLFPCPGIGDREDLKELE